MSNENLYDRYGRQMLLSGFGESAQRKLLQAKLLVVGGGGIGCPALLYLTAVGVGTIGIVDDDTVALHNLHRQVLYGTEDIGKSKSVCARKRLLALNPELNIVAIDQRLTPENALDILSEYDLVIDGTDNFSSRYLINDACVLLGKTLIQGAVSRFEGQAAVYNYPPGSVNYRDLFPQPPGEGQAPGCTETGVLGVLPGIIGAMLANEAIKIITGLGEPYAGRLFTWNARSNFAYELVITPNPETRALIPGDATTFRHTDYLQLCGVEEDRRFAIDQEAFGKLLQSGQVEVVDVREAGELPALNGIPHRQIPIQRIPDEIPDFRHNTIVMVCRSGVRSLQAARQLQGMIGTEKKVYSLKGGIVAWFDRKQNQTR